MRIPQKIHLSWKTKTIIDDKSDIVVNGIKNLIELNPTWEVDVYDDREVEQYLRDHLTGDDFALMKNTGIVDKIDLWRLFKIYHEGGLYVDIDRLCNISMSDILTDDISWLLPTCRDYDFSHDIMCSEPQNPVYACAADLYLKRRRNGWTNTYFLGTQTYMHAITQTLFGYMVDINPGVVVFEQMRAKISKLSFIKLVRENPPYDTILFKGKVGFDWETAKRQFYSSQGIKHWTGEW